MGKRVQQSSRRRFLREAVALAAYSVLCSGQTSAQGAFDLGRIAITWYPIFLYHLPTTIGLEKGFFDAEGVRIREIVGARGGGETIRAITEGNLLLGEAATAAAVLAILRAREPLVIVGAGVKSPGDIAWVVLPDSPLRRIEDLRGKRMSYTSPGSVTEQVAIMSLQRAGIDPKEVRLVASGGIGEGLALLRRREVDAAAILEPTYTLSASDLRILFYARQYVPLYLQTVILARKSLIDRNPEVVRGFLRARRRGVEAIMNDLREAARIYGRVNNLSEDLGLRVLRNSGVHVGAYYSDGRLSAAGLQTVEEGMRLSGDIPKDYRIPWRSIVDQRFLEADQRIGLP
ncbi:ABC transporter substrate-binding protein [Thermus scotoductus]|uniref:SsuA/THI5-like domain-containing protein n=1 Tax=Thermus scotoductus TaxID=37636 RepID=A0A430S295_THESC|nr:ABC transporter substrate-binding protein [Thermus scotoductus]RTG91529.1 hypothetical protein CSW51_13810 [Thermus scotoductus]RTH27812.1 hypothetical protein CSW38_02465 [Thermus scotoductus]